MAVALRSQNDIVYGTARTNTVIPAPATIVNGDVLVIVCAIEGAAGPTLPTPTPPTGFTAPTPSTGALPVAMTASTYQAKLYVWTKVASSESGSYTVTHTTADSEAWIGSYSGASGTVEACTTANGTGTTSTGVGITLATAGDGVLFLEMDWQDTTSNLSAPAQTPPTFTKQYGLSANSTNFLIADGAMASPGATGTPSITNNSTGTDPWAVVMLGLAVAGGGTNASVTAPAAPSRARTRAPSAAVVMPTHPEVDIVVAL